MRKADRLINRQLRLCWRNFTRAKTETPRSISGWQVRHGRNVKVASLQANSHKTIREAIIHPPCWKTETGKVDGQGDKQ